MTHNCFVCGQECSCGGPSFGCLGCQGCMGGWDEEYRRSDEFIDTEDDEWEDGEDE